MSASFEPVGCAEVHLLGSFELRGPADDAITLTTRKAEALLALLALRPGQVIGRERLCGMLWPEVRDAQARHSLRQTLLGLRKALPAQAFLATDARTLALDPARFQVDVIKLERGVALGTREALSEAAQVYRGDLLEGLSIDEQPFEQWLTFERERLRRLMANGLSQLIELHAKHGDLDRAIQSATQLLKLDPLDEAAHRALMQLHVRQGRRSAALTHYRALKNRLRAELGTEPEAPTERLFAAIERGAKIPGDAARSDRVTPPPPSTFSVGRDADVAVLRRRAREGAAGLTLLLGEAGVGKTHVCDRAAAELSSEGVRVLRGRCFESEQVLPFAVWSDLLSGAGLLDDPAWTPELRGDLACLVPELAPERGEVATPDPMRVFRALRELLARLSESAALLLILDDLHWADEASLRLLCFLGRRQVATHPCSILATARAEELSATPFIGSAVAELDREGLLERMQLSALTRGDSCELARHLAGDLPIEPWFEQIWSISEGNPLVIAELARSLAQGTFEQDVGQLPVPERIRALIIRRVGRLSAAARELLLFAAVAGRDFSLDLLPDPAAISGEPMAAVEELVAAQLLRACGERLDVAHDRIRETLYGEMLPHRRQWLHGQVASGLLRRHAGALEPVLGQLGYHYSKAGNAPLAVDYLIRFSKQAWRHHGVAEALAALEQALLDAARLPAPHCTTRGVEIMIRKAWCLAFLGRFSELVEKLREREAVLEALGRDELAGPFHFWWGFALTLLGDRHGAEARAERSLACARACGDARYHAYAHAMLSYLCAVSGRCREGVAHGRIATRMLAAGDEEMPEAVAITWLNLAYNHLHLGELPAALETAEQAERLGQQADSPRAASLAVAGIACAYAAGEQWERACARAEQAMQMSDSPFALVQAAFVFAWAQLGQRRVPEAVALLETICSELEKHGMRSWSSHAKTKLAEAVLGLGDAPRARLLVAEALVIARETAELPAQAAALRTQGRTNRVLGDLASAREQLESALAIYESYGAQLDIAHTRAALAELARDEGRPDAMREALQHAHDGYAALGIEAAAARTAAALAHLGEAAAL